MENRISIQIQKLISDGWFAPSLAEEKDIIEFEREHKLLLPTDLKQYFKSFNGTNDNYNERFFSFQSITNFKSIEDELMHRNGVPDYSGIVNVLADYKDCFVFCDYEFHLMTYAIKLYNYESNRNEVYVICGDSYKLIAETFIEFLTLYLEGSDKLFI